MTPKAMKITGWILTAALSLIFIMSAFMKITLNPKIIESATKMGIDPETFRMIGFVEITCLILFLIPRTGVVGSLLLIAYLGGAMCAHILTHQSIVMIIVLEIVLWIAAALRFPELTGRLFKGEAK
jgi:uncharacterized membrane protein YphA (DoxX/SURF4 family)